MESILHSHRPTGSAMDVIKVFLAGAGAFYIDYLYWVPEAIKFVILLATGVYVVTRMIREIKALAEGKKPGEH